MMKSKSIESLLNALNIINDDIDNCIYPEKAYFMGHIGTHIQDGIYKLDKPYNKVPCFAFDWNHLDYAILYEEVSNQDYGIITYFKECKDSDDFSTLYMFNKNVLNGHYIIKDPSIHRGGDILMDKLVKVFYATSNNIDNCIYPEKAYFMGYSGTHIGDGIYKIDKPYLEVPSFAFDWNHLNYTILHSNVENDNLYTASIEYFKKTDNTDEYDILFTYNRDILKNKYTIKKPKVHRGEIY